MLVQLKVFNVELDKIIENENMTIHSNYIDALIETIIETNDRLIKLKVRNLIKEGKKENVRNNRRNANKTS